MDKRGIQIRVFISSYNNVTELQESLEEQGVSSTIKEEAFTTNSSRLFRKHLKLYNLFIDKQDFLVAEPIIRYYNQSLRQL